MIPSKYYEKNVKNKIETNRNMMAQKNTDKEKPIKKKKSNVQRSKQVSKKSSIRYVLNQMAKKKRKQIPLTSATSAAHYNLSKKLDADSILKFFDNIERPIILKILTILKMNSGIISWDNDSHKLIINGKHYAGSNIVDVLTYLTSKHNHDRFYVSDYSDRTSKLYGLPDKTLDFINAINSIILARNLEDLFLMLRFHPAKLKRIRQAANEVTQKRLQRFDDLLLKASGCVPKEKGAKALRRSLGEMGNMEAHRHYPPLITELTRSVPADAKKKTTPEMKRYEHFVSILDDYKTLSPKQVEKKMRTLDELSDDEEIVLPKYPHDNDDDDDDDDNDDDVNVTPQQVMAATFETPTVSKQLQYSLRKTDERRPANMYTPATYNKQKRKDES